MTTRLFSAEFAGTFALVFAGTGAIIINSQFNGVITHVGIALTFGLVIMTMIYAFGSVSGAHFNPAVTLGFWVAKQIRLKETLPYFAAQTSGALAASLLLRFMFPESEDLGGTSYESLRLAFVFEIILTFFLMTVILSVTTGKSTSSNLAGLAIGSTVAFCAMFGGPVSGASMNPARSLGPALVSLNLDQLWMYFLAPGIGALLAVGVCKISHKKDCCQSCD